MPIEHKHIVRHMEKTQQMLAESVCMALNKKAKDAVTVIWPPPSSWTCKKKTESESD